MQRIYKALGDLTSQVSGCSLLNLPTLGYGVLGSRFIPESARWLLSRGRQAEAKKMLEKMARVNKVKLPENLFDDIDEEQKKVGYRTFQKKNGCCLQAEKQTVQW